MIFFLAHLTSTVYRYFKYIWTRIKQYKNKIKIVICWQTINDKLVMKCGKKKKKGRYVYDVHNAFDFITMSVVREFKLRI